jgi:hypothetical protein
MSMKTHSKQSLAAGLVLGAAAQLAATAPPAEVFITGQGIFPESMTSSKDGSLIIGSIGTQQIFRARPGSASAEPWIVAGTGGMRSIFGVFADDKSNTLYACSNTNPFGGPPPGSASPPASPPPGDLLAFDLKTGKPKGQYPFPTPGALCNDIAVGPDGTAYATDTGNMQVVSLKKGATALTVWAGAGGEFGPKGGVVDGVAVLGNRVFVGTLATSKLFAVPIQKDGSAGAVTEVSLDQPLQRPDGIRSWGEETLLVVEGGGGGHLSKVTISGGTGTRTVIKDGYPDGAVAVTVVGTTAYVVESQLAALMRRPGTPAPEPKPFHATAVEVGRPPSGL